MLSNEHAIGELCGQAGCFGRCQPKRCRVRSQGVIGRNSAGYKVRTLGLHPRINMLSKIAVRPAVKSAVSHRGKVVRNQVVADFVALVHDRPQCPAGGFPRKAIGIAQTRGIEALCAGVQINLPDGGASGFNCHPPLRNIAVGANRDIQKFAIGAGNQVFRPMVIDRTGGQIHQFDARRFNAKVAWRIREAHYRVRIGNIQVAADQRHAEGRIQPLQQH